MNRSFLMYGRRFFALALLFLLLTVLFCYRVDPYSLYGRYYLVDGAEVNGPGFSAQLRMGRAIAIKQRKPEVLIMGSSRSNYGFSSQAAEAFFANKNIYNASFNGANIYEMLRYFQHTVATANVKHAYIGADFFQFNGSRLVKPTFKEERLIVDVNNQPSGSAIHDFLSTLLSGDATYYSMLVYTGLSSWNYIYLPNGFMLRDRSSGTLHEFISSEKTYIAKKYTKPAFTFNLQGGSNTTFDYFRKIIQLAHEKQIDLHLFISPAHARQWEVIAQLGLWEKWEYWKREMLHITEQESSYYNQGAFPIHDFAGYSVYSTEAVPRTPDNTMRWYSDSSHYRHALGKVILNTIMNGSGEESFGRIISSQNIDTHLQSIKAEHLQYVSSHPQDISDIQQLIAKSARNLNSQTQAIAE